jgi:molybdopterin synthase sulfur carrier subunit
MPTVSFTYALKRFFPDIDSQQVDAADVRDLLDKLDVKFPGLKGYIVDDQGRLRKHVNIFHNGTLIDDRVKLSDELTNTSEVYIMQALSGG